VTLDSVQEFRVTTSNYNADQGRSSGAQVSLVTKSGTNNYHGSLYEYHRNTVTSDNDYFVKQSELLSGEPNLERHLFRPNSSPKFLLRETGMTIDFWLRAIVERQISAALLRLRDSR